MNRKIRVLHVLILVAAGTSAFVLASGYSLRESVPQIAEAAERPAAVVRVAQQTVEAAAPVETASPRETASPVQIAKTEQTASSVRPAFGAAPAEDPFQKLSWTSPPVAVVAPPPPPPTAPRAPPLPFTFIGLLEKGTPKPSAFLVRGEDLIVVSAGDDVDRMYRVESLSATEIVFTYLPLNERQTIALAGGPK